MIPLSFGECTEPASTRGTTVPASISRILIHPSVVELIRYPFQINGATLVAHIRITFKVQSHVGMVLDVWTHAEVYLLGGNKVLSVVGLHIQ